MNENKNETKKIFEEVLVTLQNKNNDYGSKIDSISLTGLEGVSVRLLDKVARVYSLSSGNRTKSLRREYRRHSEGYYRLRS